jgi:cyclohexa-1,5-dienecarbonyl-CoA hydratase
LPYRVTQPMAESLLLTGRSISAAEAAASGLVQVLAEDPEAAALEWFEQHLQGRSAAALACALTAARGQMLRDVRKRLAEVEQLYLERLMRTHDANEGLTAFLAKRQPAWTHK